MADNNKKFIEDNKGVLIEEMAEKISNLNSILASVMESPIDKDADGALMRTYHMAAALQVGSLTTLFNQYYVLLKGVVRREDNRPSGFASLIKETKPKVPLEHPKLDEDVIDE